MMPGYNTGKIVIGCHYVPPRSNPMSSLDCFWQSVLLSRKQSLLQRIRSFLQGEDYGH